MSPILSLSLSFSSVARRTLMLAAAVILAVILFVAPAITNLPQMQLLSAVAQAREPSGKRHARPVITLTLGAHSINAEVAANEADRERGLMFRNALRRNDGMLFLFDETARYCFWMRNTKIPLSIAFIDNDGIITDIDEMQPETLDNHCPTRAGRYALEMNPHWFSSRGIRAGMRISGLPLR